MQGMGQTRGLIFESDTLFVTRDAYSSEMAHPAADGFEAEPGGNIRRSQ